MQAIIIGFFLIITFGSHASADDTLSKEKAVVVKVIDGDSLEVSQHGKLRIVRLYGVDSPEWDQPYARKAKTFLKEMLLGNNVLLEVLYKDKYSRDVTFVQYDGNSVNQILVEEGLAWVHIYYCHKKICEHWKDLERKARNKKAGLWRGKNPVAPWEWKRKKKR